jgi:uncharacterized protein DUF4395
VVIAGEVEHAGERGTIVSNRRLAHVFSFPNPVNEISARLVAGGVVLMSLATIAFQQRWILVAIAYGFVARVLAGPTPSPLGQLVTRLIAPRLPVAPRPVAGPPKRFAQGLGAAMSVSAAVIAFSFGLNTVVYVLLGLLIGAATLESVFAICLGCIVFGWLMRVGVIPPEVCERCENIWLGRAAATEVATRPRRWSLAALALLGAALVIMPFVFQMFDRAPKGATMISAFKPYMTSSRLAGFQTELRQIDAGVRESDRDVAAYLSGSRSASAHTRFDATYPVFAGFRASWGRIDSDLTGMLGTIQANVGNYRAVAALPSFRLFPWFFVIPGALVLALLAAFAARPGWWRRLSPALAALGIGLVLAPVMFQMFQRAPKGERMVNAFSAIETGQRVQTIQGYFGDMAVGQGAVRLELIPALEQAGLTRGQIAKRFPAVDELDRVWVHILNDMTPMIGAMSDNVVNYQAVASLPSFSLFPWFFVLPGLLTIGLALAAAARGRRDDLLAPPVRQLGGSLPEGAP